MEKRKTIRPLHVLQIVGDPVGGLRRHVHSLLRGLDPAEFRLSYVYSQASVDSAFGRDMVELRPHLHAELPLNIHKKPHPSDIANLLRLYRFMREARVDVVHGHGAKGGLYARLAGNWSRARTVYTPHGGAAHDMFSCTEALVYQGVERLLAGITDHYLFESRYTAEAMHRKLGKLKGNWSINLNGIEPFAHDACRDFPVSLKDADRRGITRVGIFAMLREQKGQSYAIEAVAKLRHEGQNISLHLFGDGPDRCRLMAKAEALGVTDAILFYGDVSPVEPWMAAMDLVVIPSLFESFGYVAIEAMALEMPVIASATGGLIEVLQCEGATLVPPANTEALRNALREYLNAPAILQAAAKRGAKEVREKYSASAMVARTAEVYQRLVSLK